MAVKVGGGQHLAVNFCKFGTKISLRKSWVAYVFCENKGHREVSFYLFCVYNDKKKTKYKFYIHYPASIGTFPHSTPALAKGTSADNAHSNA